MSIVIQFVSEASNMVNEQECTVWCSTFVLRPLPACLNFRDLAIIFSISSVICHIFMTNLFVWPSILIPDELGGTSCILIIFSHPSTRRFWIFSSPITGASRIIAHPLSSRLLIKSRPPPHILISGIALIHRVGTFASITIYSIFSFVSW